MRFEVLPKEFEHKFNVVYMNQDSSLFAGQGDSIWHFAVLAFDYVELEFSETGIVSHADGFCPREIWQAAELGPPKGLPGELRIIPDGEILRGAGVSGGYRQLPVYYDERNHWLCIGDPKTAADFQVALNEGFIIVGNSTVIHALWIKIARFEP